MPIQVTTDLSGRRIVDPAILSLPVIVRDCAGHEIGRFRSPKKLAEAIAAGVLVLIDGDALTVGGGQ